MASISLPPFLAKLMKITQNCDPSVADWNEAGTEFIVKSDRFETDVLSKFFNGTKSTFIRQLHFYCFKKLDNKGEEWAFSHPKFQRDAPHLIYEIKRKTRKETSGPASKDEVQALRTETVNMRNDMQNMQAQIDFLTKQVEMLMAMQHSMPMGNPNAFSNKNVYDSRGGDGLYHKRPKMAPSPEAKRESDETSSDGAFSGLLPFEDGSHASYYKDDDIQSPRSFTDSSDSGLKKPAKYEDFDMPMDIGDLSDLFLGVPHDSMQHSDAPNRAPFTQMFRSNSSSSSSEDGSQALSSHPHQQQVSGFQSKVTLICSGRGQEMPDAVFTGFLSKFVEHARLLHSKNMLAGDLDPELEIFVHASLPNNSPLKDLLTYSPTKVRTVLVNVLSDASASDWNLVSEEHASAESTKIKQEDSFLERPLLVFNINNTIKEVKGACFLHFMSFLLHASLIPATNVPPVDNELSPFFAAFAEYFTPEVYAVMCLAHNRIDEAKKRGALSAESAVSCNRRAGGLGVQ